MSKVETVICLLAHSGITQPKVWRAFEKYANGHVGLTVYTESRLLQLMSDDWRAIAVHNPVETKWGDMSIVEATQQLFQTALHLYPMGQLFVLLSGDSVPCCSVQTLRKMIDSQKFYLKTHEESGLPESTQAIEELIPGYRPTAHGQFVALRRSDTVLIAKQQISAWSKFNETFNCSGCHSTIVPDEYVIGTALFSTIPSEECDTELLDDICFRKMGQGKICPNCDMILNHGQVLQGEYLRKCLSYCVKYQAAIGIRKISATASPEIIWKHFKQFMLDFQKEIVDVEIE